MHFRLFDCVTRERCDKRISEMHPPNKNKNLRERDRQRDKDGCRNNGGNKNVPNVEYPNTVSMSL